MITAGDEGESVSGFQPRAGLPFRGHLADVWRHFWLVVVMMGLGSRGDAAGIVGGGQGCCQTSYRTQGSTPPATTNGYLIQNVNYTKAEST